MPVAPSRLLVATRSRHKLRELGELLSLPAGVELLSPDDLGIEGEPDETGTTFETNARIKARWPGLTCGMSSSLTSAMTRSGFASPIQNSTLPGSAISPTSPSRRSTVPRIGTRRT